MFAHCISLCVCVCLTNISGFLNFVAEFLIARHPPDSVHALRFRNVPAWVFVCVFVYTIACLFLVNEGIIPDLLTYVVIIVLGTLILQLWELISVNMLTRPTATERAELKELHVTAALLQEYTTSVESASDSNVYTSLVDFDHSARNPAPIQRNLTAAVELQRHAEASE
jgi:hypothetical protein